MIREQHLEKYDKIALHFRIPLSPLIKIEIEKPLHLCTTNPHTAKVQFPSTPVWSCTVYKFQSLTMGSYIQYVR